jgi:hypothetical protein
VSEHNAANTGGALSSATHTIPRFPRPASIFENQETRPFRPGPAQQRPSRGNVRLAQKFLRPLRSEVSVHGKAPSRSARHGMQMPDFPQDKQLQHELLLPPPHPTRDKQFTAGVAAAEASRRRQQVGDPVIIPIRRLYHGSCELLAVEQKQPTRFDDTREVRVGGSGRHEEDSIPRSGLREEGVLRIHPCNRRRGERGRPWRRRPTPTRCRRRRRRVRVPGVAKFT